MDRRNFNKVITFAAAAVVVPSSLAEGGTTVSYATPPVPKITDVSIETWFNLEQDFGGVEVKIDYTLNNKNYTVELEGSDKTWYIVPSAHYKIHASLTDQYNNIIEADKLNPKEFYDIEVRCDDYIIKMNKFKLKE